MRKEKIMAPVIVIALVFVVSIILPWFITLLWTGKVGMLSGSIDKSGYTIIMEDNTKMDMETFIPCVVMAQNADKAEDEMIKAQMVIFRTKILRKMRNNVAINVAELDMPYYSYSDMESEYGKNYIEKYAHVCQLLKETNKQIITFEGKLIHTYYHEVSSGVTRNGDEPYLISVDSADDVTAPEYLSLSYYTPEEFEKAIKKAWKIDIGVDDNIAKVQINNEDGTGYIKSVNITGVDGTAVEIAGDEFAKELKLSSPCFIIEKFNEAIRIVVKGIGNGKGMSLYGAEKMAEGGADYTEILTHYYSNAVLTPINAVETSSNMENM